MDWSQPLSINKRFSLVVITKSFILVTCLDVIIGCNFMLNERYILVIIVIKLHKIYKKTQNIFDLIVDKMKISFL